MKTSLDSFKAFLREAEDPNYYQDTFYFTLLISMHKEMGGSRDETKNDIRALSEILTVTLVEAEKGGVQRDIGTKYLSTLKVHVRKPKDVNKKDLMRRLVLRINNLRGVSVLRYKETKPKTRRKAFHGTYNINEGDYYQSEEHMDDVVDAAKALTSKGPQTTGGGSYDTERTRLGKFNSSPPNAPGGLEEIILDEVMMGPKDLPEGVVVVVRKESDGTGFKIYYAERDKPNVSLKPGDLDRMENGPDVFGAIEARLGREEPYDGIYIVQSSKAKDKFGPLLYDVALEVAGKAGLKPMNDDVSDDASAVWKHYDEKRKEDVRSTMLVPEEDHDAYSLVMPYVRAEHPEDNKHLAKAYFKKDKSVTQKLIEQDKFVELKPGTKVSTPSAREELTDLAAELDIPIVKNTDLGRFDRLYEDVLITIGAGQGKDDLMAFDVQPDLNQKIWDGEASVRPGVKAAIMDIVDEFLEGLDLEAEIKDVIITGSIANYNWSKFSDIDVHILVDFAEVNDNTKMVKKFFDSVRSNWNKLHVINVKGHEVELYVQEEKEPHVSTGVYSLLTDSWIVKPKKVKPELDKDTATKKMLDISREIDKLSMIYDRGQHQGAFDLAERIKEKIKRMRRSGLDRSGIYSPENLAFKMLRRSGDIEQLFSIYTQAYDRLYSLDQ
jgi:predicted nucleotidyltransferase